MSVQIDDLKLASEEGWLKGYEHAILQQVQKIDAQQLLIEAEQDLAKCIKETGNVHPTQASNDLYAFIREMKRRLKEVMCPHQS